MKRATLGQLQLRIGIAPIARGRTRNPFSTQKPRIGFSSSRAHWISPRLTIGLTGPGRDENDDPCASLDPGSGSNLPVPIVRFLHRHVDEAEWRLRANLLATEEIPLPLVLLHNDEDHLFRIISYLCRLMRSLVPVLHRVS